MQHQSSVSRLILLTVAGSVLTSLVGAAFIGLMFGLPLLIGDIPAMDREKDLIQFPGLLALGATVGAILGGLAVFASRFPRRGLPLTASFSMIALSAGFVRLMTEQHYKTDEPPLLDSYLASLIAAMCAAALVVALGYVRRSAKVDSLQQHGR